MTMNGNGSVPQSNQVFSGSQRKDNVLICSTPWDAFLPANSCFILPERTQIVELYFGGYHGTITDPGCYCRNSWFVDLRTISTALKTLDLPNVKVVDLNGSPLIVSGTVTYEVTDARKAAIDVASAFEYVHDIAPTVLKRIVAQYPYESSTDAPEETSLQNASEEVGAVLCNTLQKLCYVAGVRIEQFVINELSYAPEIAQVMLKRQQADAVVDARRSIVHGAKEIALSTVQDMKSELSEEDRSKLLSNLLVVLVGDHEAVPTVSIGT